MLGLLYQGPPPHPGCRVRNSGTAFGRRPQTLPLQPSRVLSRNEAILAGLYPGPALGPLTWLAGTSLLVRTALPGAAISPGIRSLTHTRGHSALTVTST